MTELFGRRATLTIDTVEITGLRIDFQVRKTIKKEPNTARISVWNLAEETRKSIQKDRVRVTLQAGYVDNISLLFAGDLRIITSRRAGPDWITNIESGDGETALQVRIAKSFTSATFKTLLEESAKKLGVGIGNAAELAAQGKFQDALTSLSNGVVLNDRVVNVIDRLASSAQLEWSVQDGQLQFLKLGEALGRSAVLLTPDTGLVGSPELGEDGSITARSLLQPTIFPGVPVQVQSRQIDAFFRCESAEYVGDTRGSGGDWYTEFEGKPI